MLSDLTQPQRALADFMSDLSEEAFFAGWMDGLEFALWEVVLGLRVRYGQIEIDRDRADRLRALADGCGGWIVFDDVREETWVSHAAWDEMYAAQRLRCEQGL